MIPLGAPVTFLWRRTNTWLDGIVVDHTTFNGHTMHAVRTDGGVYRVWPDTPLIVDVWRQIT